MKTAKARLYNTPATNKNVSQPITNIIKLPHKKSHEKILNKGNKNLDSSSCNKKISNSFTL